MSVTTPILSADDGTGVAAIDGAVLGAVLGATDAVDGAGTDGTAVAPLLQADTMRATPANRARPVERMRMVPPRLARFAGAGHRSGGGFSPLLDALRGRLLASYWGRPLRARRGGGGPGAGGEGP